MMTDVYKRQDQQIAEKVKCEAQQSAEQRASGAGSDHRRPHGTDLSRQTADDTGKDDDGNTVSDSLQRDAVTKPKQENASGGEDRRDIEAVSYTHLDVYKRQIISFAIVDFPDPLCPTMTV